MREFAITLLLTAMIILMGSTIQAQTAWTKYEGNPVMNVGSPGSWDDNYILEPWVIMESWAIGDGPTYRMFYQGNDGNFSRIGSATSDDGVNWTKEDSVNPVLDQGPSGSWDDDNICCPSVMVTGNDVRGFFYQMWYRGNDGATSRIGYATSIDGLNWTKDSLNPVLDAGPASSWDGTGVSTPVVLLVDTTYFMWYGGNDGSNVRIGLATSSDGLEWMKHPQNPVMSIGTGWESRQVFPESVIYDGSLFQMWYLGLNSSFEAESGYATSPDGVTWDKHPDNPVLNVGDIGEWDDVGAGVGAVLFDETDTTYHMWYDSFDGAVDAVGYATAPKDSTIISIANEGIIPDKYQLSQNYPNPFNPETVIRYSIPKTENVSLTVYNLIGEKVVNLIDEQKPAGSYTVKWDASDVASGIYFYRLQAGDFVRTRKMILLK